MSGARASGFAFVLCVLAGGVARIARKAKRVPVVVWIDPQWLPRIDRITATYAERNPHANYRRAHALRGALMAGTTELERYLGLDRQGGKE